MFELCDNVTNINNIRIVVLNIEIIVQRLKATVHEHEPFHNVAQLLSLDSVELRTDVGMLLSSFLASSIILDSATMLKSVLE